MEEPGAAGEVWVGDRAVGVTSVGSTLVCLLIFGSPCQPSLSKALDQPSLGRGGPARDAATAYLGWGEGAPVCTWVLRGLLHTSRS